MIFFYLNNSVFGGGIFYIFEEACFRNGETKPEVKRWNGHNGSFRQNIKHKSFPNKQDLMTKGIPYFANRSRCKIHAMINGTSVINEKLSES